MSNAPAMPNDPPPRDDAPSDVEQPLVVRIYGELKHRILKYSNRKGVKRATVVKLLTGEALEREGF